MPEATAPPARRTPFASGEYLTRFPPGAPHALRLDCRREKPGWQARLPGGLVEATFPGTAVLFENHYYEIAAAREVGGWVSYYLDPWDDAMVLRRIVELSPAASESEHRERSADLLRRSSASSLAILMPLVGFLPAEVQERIERTHSIPASRATAWSAALALAVAAVYFVLSLAASIGAAMAGGAAAPRGSRFATYFMVESLLRLGGALAAGEAMGTLPVVLPYAIWQAAARRRRPAAASAERPSDALAAHDEVTVHAGDPRRLSILSLLDKPHWSKAIGIRYQGSWYRLESATEETRGGSTLHRFTLVADPDAQALRGACDYDPREIVELRRRALVARHATWVETLAPLWGLLGDADQRRLEELYDYSAARATAWSIYGGVVFGGLAVALAVTYLATGSGSIADALLLPLAGFVLVDALRRWGPLRRGDIVASALAPLVRRLCNRFLNAS
jgi:hypothetical protein